MNVSPHEIEVRWNDFVRQVNEIDNKYESGIIDPETATALYRNAKGMLEQMYYDLSSESADSQDYEWQIRILGMIGVVYTRIAQIWQEYLDFEESFSSLVEGINYLRKALLMAPSSHPLSNWITEMINWWKSLSDPIIDKRNNYNEFDPNTWRSKEPDDVYLAQIGLRVSILASRRISIIIRKILEGYTQFLMGKVTTIDDSGRVIPAPLERVVPSFTGDINAILNEIYNLRELADRLGKANLPSEMKWNYEKILELYSFSLNQVRSILSLLQPYLNLLPKEIGEAIETLNSIS